jgi:hypothetical protein
MLFLGFCVAITFVGTNSLADPTCPMQHPGVVGRGYKARMVLNTSSQQQQQQTNLSEIGSTQAPLNVG